MTRLTTSRRFACFVLYCVVEMSATGRQMALGYGTTTKLYDGMLEIYKYVRLDQIQYFDRVWLLLLLLCAFCLQLLH